MKTTFTPGTWYVHHTDHFRRVLAKTDTETEPCIVDHCYIEADARLIAAAPDLLAALEDAEFLLRKAAQVSGPMKDSFKRSAEDARAAISKARGES